jgi:multisubunit Na+/H+ antiporter MnhC subunit
MNAALVACYAVLLTGVVIDVALFFVALPVCHALSACSEKNAQNQLV